MPLTTSPERAEQKLLGQALRRLREERRLPQSAIAEPLGMTTQGWQKYEAGERSFSDERVAAVLAILRANPEDLEFEKARILGAPAARATGVAERGRDFVIDVYGKPRLGAAGLEVHTTETPSRQIDLRHILGPSADAIEVADERMVPWAWPGEVVIFDRDRAPRRGQGCVIELTTGEIFARLYERSDGSNLFVQELSPEPRTVTVELSKVKGVYAVKLRGD